MAVVTKSNSALYAGPVSRCRSGSNLLGNAIRAIGTESFSAALMRLAQHWFDAAQVVAFRVMPSTTVVTLIAENVTEGPARAWALANSYCASYHCRDPHAGLLASTAGGPASTICRLISAADIPDPAYRQALFRQPRLTGKLSLLGHREEDILYINFYRGLCRSGLQVTDLQWLNENASLLFAMLDRHLGLGSTGPASRSAIASLICTVAGERGASLSNRELAVCTLIVAGLSMEGIALELAVSPNSAISYRRRAFQKLGIATQKELFAKVLGVQHG